MVFAEGKSNKFLKATIVKQGTFYDRIIDNYFYCRIRCYCF